jgi:predicted acyltransferase
MDQLRGYTIFGMVLVNYLGQFEVMPWMLKHHREGMSYADTIAPLFIFIVGMGFRMSLVRRAEQVGVGRAMLAAARRYAVLVLIGIAVYGPNDPGSWYDALVDIGVGGLLSLPFLLAGTWVRVAVAFGYLALFQGLFSLSDYGPWLVGNSFNGGPLGVFSWASILLLGTVAQDIASRGNPARTLLGWGVGLCAAGWALRAAWPGLKAEWPFSQYWMTAPYVLYSTGLCFLTCLFFIWLCGRRGIELPHLTVLGRNPLVLYLVQYALINLSGTFIVGRDASVPMALLGFALFYMACYAVAWRLWKDGVVVKI